MSADEQTSKSSRGLIIGIIAAALLIPGLTSAYLVYSRLGAREAPAFAPVADYLDAPDAIPERVAAVGTELSSLKITRGSLELVDAQGQRHSITPNGEWLRRGSADAPAPSFALAAVDFAKLPVVLAAATTDGGGSPNSVSVELADGAPRWIVQVWAEGGSKDVTYAMDGTLIP